MPGALPSLLAAGFADIAAALGVPLPSLAGTVLGEALARLMQTRGEDARKILLGEIGEGLRPPKDPGEIDEFVAIIYRYMRASQEGAAHLNLRLMARVMRKQIEAESLYASEFLRLADLLASLSREEIVLLAVWAREKTTYDAAQIEESWDLDGYIKSLQNLYYRVSKSLVPDFFSTDLKMSGTLAALQRTGMFQPLTAAKNGFALWRHTPLLDQLVALSDLEDILRNDGTTPS